MRRIVSGSIAFIIVSICPLQGAKAESFDPLWGDREIAQKVYGGVPSSDGASRSEKSSAFTPEADTQMTTFSEVKASIETSAKISNEKSTQENELFIKATESDLEFHPDDTQENKTITERESIRKELLRQVETSWLPSTATVKGDTEEVVEEESPVEKKLRNIIIPKICFSHIPLRDALDQLSELSLTLDPDPNESKGVNIIVLDQPDNEIYIQLTLRNVPLGKVIDYVAKSAGYDFDIEDDTVVLTSSEKNRERLVTRNFPLTRATVVRLTNLRQSGHDFNDPTQILQEEELLKKFFERSGVNFSDINGSALAFDGTQIIVTQIPKNIKRLQAILANYNSIDQIEIETKFLEVQQGTLDELQFRWSFHNSHVDIATGKGNYDSLRTLAQGFSSHNNASQPGSIVIENPSSTGGTDVKTIPISNEAPAIPNGINLGQNTTPLIDVLSVINGAQLGFMMRALEQETGSDLMSAPKLTVLSGKTAEIVIAQELRYPQDYGEIQSSVGNSSGFNSTSSAAGVTITAGTPRNFKTRNVGVEMAVTPIVERDGKISLQLEPSVTEFEGFVEYGGVSVAVAAGTTVTVPSGFFQPIFSTRKISTEVTIEDGATVVMGGLTREEVKEIHDKTPILGDIPLLGKLFRSKGKSSQKRNLLIFVTAKRVDPHGCDFIEGEIIHKEAPIPEFSEENLSRKVKTRHF